MKDNYTEIVVVLDRSGSMASIWGDAMGGLAAFIKDQQKESGECKLTLVAFDNEYEVPINAQSIKNVGKLVDYQLTPRGSTALLDALGKSINATGKRLADMAEKNRPSKVIFLIITDGQENCSREFTNAQIETMIKKQTDEFSWDFLYQGANQDSFSVAGSIGIRSGAIMNYAATTKGVQSSYLAASAAVSRGRAAPRDETQFTEEERDNAK